MARSAALALGCVLLAGAVIGGYTGAWFGVAKAQEKQGNPYFTIGCRTEEVATCPKSRIVTTTSVKGDRYVFAQAGLPDLHLKKCSGSPPWPMNQGDRFYSFTYEERYADQCEALGPHWGWYAVRDKDHLTDSERLAKGGKS